MTISLRKAVMLLLGASVVLALVPAGIALERRLVVDLESRDREDLARAPPADPTFLNRPGHNAP